MTAELLVFAFACVSLSLFVFLVAYISTGCKLPKLPSLKWKRLTKKDSEKPTTILANLLAAKILSLPLTRENKLELDTENDVFKFKKVLKNVDIEYIEYWKSHSPLYCYNKAGHILLFSEGERQIIIEAIQKLQELIKKQEEIDHLAYIQKTAIEAISEFMGVDSNDTNDK